MSITLPPLTPSQRRIWPPEVVASYEAQQQMTDEERRHMALGFLTFFHDPARVAAAVAQRDQIEVAS